MKLRIQGNSVRIRLNRAEVAWLAAGKTVSQMTEFPGSTWLKSSVQSLSGAVTPSASFHDAHLAVVLPGERTRHWTESDEVSIRAELPIGGDLLFSLLIEKDFECLHRLADDADAFPNPRAQETK